MNEHHGFRLQLFSEFSRSAYLGMTQAFIFDYKSRAKNQQIYDNFKISTSGIFFINRFPI